MGLGSGNGQLVARLQSHYRGEALEYQDKRSRLVDGIHTSAAQQQHHNI